MRNTIIVHGGAGSGKYAPEDPRFGGLEDAVTAGLAAMRRGSSLDGVVEAVESMESSGLFNAGRGACLTIDGRVQLDAAVATGTGRRGAGVGACTCTYHPVLLARFVMDATDHVLIAGQECEALARAAEMETGPLFASDAAVRRYQEVRKRLGESHPKHLRFAHPTEEGNTVGAVAVDSDGLPSAAVSTGGMWLKLPGRIGDSAILGAGVYADVSSGAACATGTGEEIIRCALSWNACALMKRVSAPLAAKRAIAFISKESGRNTAGIVTVDRKGRLGFSYNTDAMGRAWYDAAKGRVVTRV